MAIHSQPNGLESPVDDGKQASELLGQKPLDRQYAMKKFHQSWFQDNDEMDEDQGGDEDDDDENEETSTRSSLSRLESHEEMNEQPMIAFDSGISQMSMPTIPEPISDTQINDIVPFLL